MASALLAGNMAEVTITEDGHYLGASSQVRAVLGNMVREGNSVRSAITPNDLPVMLDSLKTWAPYVGQFTERPCSKMQKPCTVCTLDCKSLRSMTRRVTPIPLVVAGGNIVRLSITTRVDDDSSASQPNVTSTETSTTTWTTPSQIARRTGVSARYVREEILAGRLEAIRFGTRGGHGTYRVPVAVAEAYIKRTLGPFYEPPNPPDSAPAFDR